MMVFDQILQAEATQWALDNPDQVQTVTDAINDPLTLLPGYSDFKGQAAALGNALQAITENPGVWAIGILLTIAGFGLIWFSWGEKSADALQNIADKLPQIKDADRNIPLAPGVE